MTSGGRAALIGPFLTAVGWADARRRTIAGDASNRSYERLTRPDGATAILMDSPPDRGEDVRPFIGVADYLCGLGLSAPRLYHRDETQGLLLIEDLGDALFARLMAADPARQAPLYRAAADVLVTLHGAPVMNLPLCDAEWLTGMMEPAFSWYAPQGGAETAAQVATLFLPFAQSVAEAEQVVILRDYHAENLLWLPDRLGAARVGLLDFQDALIGHPAYDLVSILQDARRDVPEDVARETIQHYLAATGTDPDAFGRAYAILGLQRNLRILGIFARLCLRDGKSHYIDMIPRVWQHVQTNLRHPDLASLAELLHTALPTPTPDFLNQLKSKCATIPDPS